MGLAFGGRITASLFTTLRKLGCICGTMGGRTWNGFILLNDVRPLRSRLCAEPWKFLIIAILRGLHHTFVSCWFYGSGSSSGELSSEEGHHRQRLETCPWSLFSTQNARGLFYPRDTIQNSKSSFDFSVAKILSIKNSWAFLIVVATL